MITFLRAMFMIIPSKRERNSTIGSEFPVNVVRVGVAVAVENINHFKTLAVKTRTSVLEQKAKPPILDSNADPSQ